MGNLEEFAALLSCAFEEKKKTIDGRTNNKVGQIYDTAMVYGAISCFI